MMDWMQFLEGVAVDCAMTPDQKRAFLARFDRLNVAKTDQWITKNVKDDRGDLIFAGEAAFKKLMTGVYRAIQRELFPELEKVAKGKKEKLEAFLRESWRKAPQPPILGEPSQERRGGEDVGSVQSPLELGDLGCEDVARSTTRSGLKPGVPMPRVRLPENFVDRPAALSLVKEKLLLESEQTLVVSAIAGLGGLGKSVLATAIVLDEEVQRRFEDGILWVTLGQNPDLQSCLGDWIRALDKSRDSFSATTLESASGYLHNLLAERRMLLVVDDVWNAAHAEWFRVGGTGCRVLVTTREARIEGAEVYPLALMSEGEAIDLVRRKLGRLWKAADEGEVRSFAKVLGYLPLALDLAANQVRDGLSWGELRSEFEDERRSVALEILDSSEAWEQLSEDEQRKYSLRACFNLSLKRLKPEQLRRFAWLGVLPEDVDLNGTIAEMLWDVRPIQAKKGLIDLRSRSFLTDGVQTIEGVATYRVHDLMHDTARGLIEKGELGIESLEMAHGAFLERYRGRSEDGSWYGLKNDGYIHRHLTWHLEMAGRFDEVHELMASGEDQNDWFEACDKIGQPGIFVEDVWRGWRLAEELYDRDRERAIVLQCRYALITGTLNSLVGSLSGELMAVLVKRSFWSVEQAWAYVEEMQDENKIAGAIQALAAYLTKPLFEIAVEKARSIQEEYYRAKVLSTLAQTDHIYFSEALEVVRSMDNKPGRIEILENLAKIGSENYSQLLDVARSIQDEFHLAVFLGFLTKIDSTYFHEALESARLIQSEADRAQILVDLAQIDSTYFPEALEAARSIQEEHYRAKVLSNLARVDFSCFPEALEAARSIQDESLRASVLSNLAQVDFSYFPEALEAARSIQDESLRASVLSDLARVDFSYFPEALKSARLIRNEYYRAKVLSNLAQIDSADLSQLLESVQSIQDKYDLAKILVALAQVDSSFFSETLEAVKSIQDESRRSSILVQLVPINPDYFTEVLVSEVVRSIQNEVCLSRILVRLATINSTYFTEALEVVRSIEHGHDRAVSLFILASIQGNSTYLAEAWESTRLIQNEVARARFLRHLIQTNAGCFPQVLEVARSIQDESWRAWVLVALAKIDSAYCIESLETAQSIQNESWRASILKDLALIDSTYFPEALEAAQLIQDTYKRSYQLIELAQIDSVYYAEALEATLSISDENYCIKNLIRLSAQMDSADFSQLPKAVRLIQCETIRSDLLSELAESIPKDCLPNLYQAITEITHKPSLSKALSSYISRLPLLSLQHTDWKTYLHLLAHRKRADLMGDLTTLYPAILNLGGEDAGRGIVEEMGRICKQWK